MSSYVQVLFDRYRPLGMLMDANLQLLHLVGGFDLRLVGDGKFNKLSKYTVEDYHLLRRLTDIFRRRVTTPHVLTEVSNLAGDLPQATRTACYLEMKRTLEQLEELAVPSLEAANRPEYQFLGLTDAGLASVSARFLIVTDDARMVAHLNRSGLEALNFNHLRDHLFR